MTEEVQQRSDCLFGPLALILISACHILHLGLNRPPVDPPAGPTDK